VVASSDPNKLFPSQSGFPTPNDPPDSTACRTFQVPADEEYYALLMGALDALRQPYNWYINGSLSQQEAADIFAGILDAAYEQALSGQCDPDVPTPWWDTATDSDDMAAVADQPWYGLAVVTYASPPEVTFVEQVAIWLFAGFIVYSGQPGAALAFLTIAPKFVIALKTGDVGAVVDLIVDASRVGRYNTYSPTPGVMRIPVVGNPDLDEHQIYIVKDDDPDTVVQVVRDELNPDDVAPSNLRYNPGTDTVEIQGADGTWGENPAADPRSSPAYQFPPVTADDPACQAASNVTRQINNLIDEVLLVLPEAFDAAGLLTLLIGFLVELGPFGVLIDLVLGLAFILFSAGTTAIAAAFPNEVYDQLICIFKCNMDTDGQMSVEQLAAAQAQIDSDIGGLAATILDAMFFLMGNVGISNWGTVDGGEPVDCSDCECTWCYTWDFTSSDGGWDNCFGRGTYSPGVGWVSSVGTGFVAATPNSGNNSDLHANIEHWEATITASGASGNGYVSNAEINDSCTFTAIGYMSLDGVPTFPGYGLENGSHVYTWDAPDPTNYAGIFVNPVINDEDASLTITRVTVSGHGSMPDFTGGELC
jgi:hypothetical protein